MSEALKRKGNKLFLHNRFKEATAVYAAAINVDPQNYKLYCNRSASRLRSGSDSIPGALTDALTAVSINPYWPKCYLRLGNALREMCRFNEAVEAYRKGLRSGDRKNPLPSILFELKKTLNMADPKYATRKVGVGGYIQFLINTCDLVRVSAECENCWCLVSGRIAKKRTYGQSWLWYRFDKFPRPSHNRFHPGLCEQTPFGRRHKSYRAPQRYDDPEHDWSLAKSKNWGRWSCCRGEANSPPCTARLNKATEMCLYQRCAQTRQAVGEKISRTKSAHASSQFKASSNAGAVPAAVRDAKTSAKKRKKHDANMPPDPFLCPITLEVMTDPVMDPEGNTFERSAIMEWLQMKNISPISRNPVRVDQLVPNRNLKALIQEFQSDTCDL